MKIVSETKDRIILLLPPSFVILLKKIRSRIRARRWQRTHSMVTKRTLIEDLMKLGVLEGNVVLVHSSLRSLGFVEGGAETVVDALIEAVGRDGTIVMPSLTIIGSQTQTLSRGVAFDPKRSPSTVGAITEAFRAKSGVYRSIHPTHSFCAYGAKAKWITDGHRNAGTNFGKDTPLYKVMEADGLILGLGIDFGPVTFLHVIEDVDKEFPIRVYCEREYVAKVIDTDGVEREMNVKAHDPEVAKTRIDNEQGKWIREFITEYLSDRGFLQRSYVAEAKSWVIKAKDLFQGQKELLRRGITIYTTQQQYERSQIGR